MYCWKCQAPFDQSPKLSFRALCPKCDTPLHVCKQCKHYMPGKPNDCNVPGTDPIADREKMNFCEDFYAKDGKSIASSPNPADIAKRLFKD